MSLPGKKIAGRISGIMVAMRLRLPPFQDHPGVSTERRRLGLRLSGTLLAITSTLLLSFGQNPGAAEPESTFEQYNRAAQSAESRWREGNFRESSIFLNQALGLARKMRDGEKEVRCSMLLGKLCWASGRPEDSQKYYSDALSRAKALNLKREAEECRAAIKIWEVYSRGKEDRIAGKYNKSVENFDSAVKLAETIGSREHEIRCLRQLSLTHLARHDLGGFLSVNEKSLQIARESNDRTEQANSLMNIGYYFLNSGEYSKALNNYSEARDLARNIANKECEAVCLKNISLILIQLGIYERSSDYLLEAREIDQRLENLAFYAQDLNTLGEGFRSEGLIFSSKSDLYQALTYFQEALDSARSYGDQWTEVLVLNNVGNTYLDLGYYHTAQSYLRSACQIAEKTGDHEALIEIFINLGICWLETGHRDKAEYYFRKALRPENHTGSDRLLWKPLFYLGQCYEKKQAYGQALACYENSIESIDFLRSQIPTDYYKVGFGKNKFRVYESAIDLLSRLGEKDISPGNGEEIFRLVERAKARSFLETLGKPRHELGRYLEPSLRKKEDEISSRISAVVREVSQGDLPKDRLGELQRTLGQLEDEYLTLTSSLGASETKVTNFTSPLPLRVRQVQERLLDEKTAILEYFLGEKSSLLFSITKNEFTIFHLPPRAEIQKSIGAYAKLLSDPPKGKWKGAPAAERLSRDLLFAALIKLPKPIDRLIIIPDGMMFRLPFETLPLLRDQTSGEDLLISKYAVSYGSSCSSLLILKEAHNKYQYRRGLLAFGSPADASIVSSAGKNKISLANIMKETFQAQGFDFSPLPQSKQEIKDVSRYFSKNNRAVYLGSEAAKETIKKMPLDDYQIIHFACHGFLDEKIPFRSALVLCSNGKSGEDGFLQAREIANLRLAAELVVLSACQTSRGYDERGEGILGLTRSFFFSGARSVVSTLWEIGDKAAAKFMGDFYYQLSQKNDKAQALRQAKLGMLKSRYSHPFYWAAFVLHGEPTATLDVH
jgi:CHAT domain-containing protein